MLRTGILLMLASTLTIAAQAADWAPVHTPFAKTLCILGLSAAFCLFMLYLARTEGWLHARRPLRHHAPQPAHVFVRS